MCMMHTAMIFAREGESENGKEKGEKRESVKGEREKEKESEKKGGGSRRECISTTRVTR